MADLNCKACEDLKKEVPSLIVNGFSNSMCASMKNDTGLKASSDNNDCEDLDLLNDCLIGNLEDEVDRYDTCDWKAFTKMFANNAWTTFKGVICAICGLWTNVHNLWATVRSFCITKTGKTISLTSNLGTHCSVTDSDTTYDLSISGHTVTLTGSDGTEDSVTVPDNNTKYDLSINGHTVKLTGTDGTTDSVTVPDNDTTYGISRSGHTVTLVPGGTNMSVTIPDENTTYNISRSGHTVTLNGSDGTTDSVTLPDDNTTYTLSRDGHTVTLNGSDGSTDSVTIPDNDHTRIGVTLINVKMKNGLSGNSATGEKTIRATTTRNSISGFEIWNENGGDILNPPAGISAYRMFGLVGYSSDHWQIMSAGSYVEINEQTITFQFVNTSPNAVTDDVVIQFHLAWYRPDND